MGYAVKLSSGGAVFNPRIAYYSYATAGGVDVGTTAGKTYIFFVAGGSYLDGGWLNGYFYFPSGVAKEYYSYGPYQAHSNANHYAWMGVKCAKSNGGNFGWRVSAGGATGITMLLIID